MQRRAQRRVLLATMTDDKIIHIGDSVSDEHRHDELSTREAATALGRNVRAVRRAIERGKLPAVKRGSSYRIAVDDLMRYAARGKPLSVSPPRGRVVSFPSPPAFAPSLPQPLSSFVGRAAEIAAVVALLEAPAVRLLTLTGPGGIGKTRLALAAGNAARERFPDGVVFVELAAVSRPELVLPAICQALGLREIAGRDRRQQLHAFLREKRLLLIVDNLEHLLAAASEIAEFAVEAPHVTLLLTSRAPLHVAGEQEFPVVPLSLPPAGSPVTAASLLASDAARLFVARAQAHDPSFSVTEESTSLIADICARLDGLPLAIELAAARVKVLSPRQLRDRLVRRLPLLTRGVRNGPQRHRNMRDAIAWSYDLLSAEEQTLFRRLAIFVGGFTLEAAEWVGGRSTEDGGESAEATPRTSDIRRPTPDSSDTLDLIAALVDQGLLARESGPEGEPRFRLLETIREYGLEQLTPDEEDSARAAHARFFLQFAQALRPLANTRSTRAPLDRLAADDANLRAAAVWFDEHEAAAELASLVAACYVHWYIVSTLKEAEAWLHRALAKQDRASTADRARLRIGCAEILLLRGEPAQADPLFDEGIALLRAIGDPFDLAMALTSYGVSLNLSGQYAAGKTLHGESLNVAESIDDQRLQAAVAGRALANLSDSVRGQGDLDLATANSERALRRYQEHHLELAENRALVDLGHIAKDQGNDQLAVAHYLACLERSGDQGEMRSLSEALDGVASVAAAKGQDRAALLLFSAASSLRERVGLGLILPVDAAQVEGHLGALREALGDDASTAIWAEGRALSIPEAVAIAATVAPLPTTPVPPTSGERIVLTPRELDVLRLLAAGQTDREIADALFIGLRTVSWHVSAILAKLEASSRREAVARARAAGFI
jgi:excisionase family DNA binding protein